jgi:hypothetical protein
MSAIGSVLCFHLDSQVMGLAHGQVGRGLWSPQIIAARSPCCLNFSVDPHQNLSFSMTTSCGCVLLRNSGKTPWDMIVPCFQVPKVSQVSNNRFSFKMALAKALHDKGDWQNVWGRLVFHTGTVIAILSLGLSGLPCECIFGFLYPF